MKNGKENLNKIPTKNIIKFQSFLFKIIHFQIWVWHTRTVPPDESDFEAIDTKILHETNLGPLSNFWYVKSLIFITKFLVPIRKKILCSTFITMPIIITS